MIAQQGAGLFLCMISPLHLAGWRIIGTQAYSADDRNHHRFAAERNFALLRSVISVAGARPAYNCFEMKDEI
jgi:hypothetical protein